MTRIDRRRELPGARGFRGLTGFLFTLLAWASPAVAQEQGIPLSIEIEPSSYSSRTCGPLPLNLRMRWSGSQLLEGRLEIDVLDDSVRLFTVISDELVLSQGETRSSWLLPNVNRPAGVGQIDLDLKWLSGGKTLWSSRVLLRVPGEVRRTFVIGVCSGEPELKPAVLGLLPIFSIERVLPLGKDLSPDERPVITMSPVVAASELSSEPLALCVYDVLLLDESGLRVLSPSQRQAVVAWVRAGGGAVVAGDDTTWRPSELSFLSELLAEAPDVAPMARDGRGLTLVGPGEPALAVISRLGLGRVVIVADSTTFQGDESLARDTTTFLWNLRRDQVVQVPGDNFPQLNFNATDWSSYPGSPIATRTALRQPRAPDMTALVDDLMPRGVRVVPLWLIAAVLGTYVLLIGPIDFLCLGWIRRRKWTWITFPFVTAIVAISATHMTRVYVRAHGPQRSIRFVDIVRGGDIVRDSRISLLFAAEPQEIATEHPRGLFTAYRNDEVDSSRLFAMQYGLMADEAVEDPSPPIIEGRMPHATTTRQQLLKWTSRLNHTSTIPLGKEAEVTVPATFNWDAAAESMSQPRQLTPIVRSAFGSDAAAYVYRGLKRESLLDRPRLFESTIRDQRFVTVPIRVGNQTIRQRVQVAAVPFDHQAPEGDLIDQTTARRSGVFTFVSRISPACDPALEDLTLLDTSDPDQAALVIAVPSDAGWTVYRRLYHRTGDTWR